MKSATIEIAPIGVVHSPRKQEAGMPNQSRWAYQTEVNIEVFPEFAEGRSGARKASTEAGFVGVNFRRGFQA